MMPLVVTTIYFNLELLAYHVFNHEWQTICVTSMSLSDP